MRLAMKKYLHLFIACLAFVLVTRGVLQWQSALQNGKPLQLSRSEELHAASGLCLLETRHFFYFYYYLGLLPVTAIVAPTEYSKEGAEAFVKENGHLLRNDLNRPCAIGRAGDYGKFFLLLPHAWHTKTPRDPSTIRATSFIFKLSLISIIAAAFILKRYFLGVTLVLLLGSYRFQLFEAYFRNNILSISISCCILLLALNLRFMNRSSSREWSGDWGIALLSGFTLALAAAVRGDVLPMAVSVLGVYLVSGQRIKRTLALCGVFLFTLLATNKGFEIYFQNKVKEANQFVVAAGGTLHGGTALAHHPIWHPILAGWGDFGTDRGFVWDDRAIFQMALPHVNRKYNYNFEFRDYHYVEPGMAEHEWVKPETTQEYSDVTRELVISTIKSNPWWFLEILKKRIQKLPSSFSTARITWSGGDYSFPLSKWIFLPILLACLMLRRLDSLKLVAFSLPTCFVPVFITSVQGTPNYAIPHLIAAAVCLDACVFLAYQAWLKVCSFRSVRYVSDSTNAATDAAS